VESLIKPGIAKKDWIGGLIRRTQHDEIVEIDAIGLRLSGAGLLSPLFESNTVMEQIVFKPVCF